MKKTPCDTIFESDSNFEGRLINDGQTINALVNCLALEHRRFDDALMSLAAASASLATDPLNSGLHQRATQAWAGLKSDLWFHLERENDLVIWWAETHIGYDFVRELSREQRAMRELVRQVEAVAPKENEAALFQARAFVALANLLDRHIEHHENSVFPVIRKATAPKMEEARKGSPPRVSSPFLKVADGQPPNV